jgi:NAD(P)-dependent dehydrogenase (short-subunit alcohol dehydrogenase family)
MTDATPPKRVVLITGATSGIGKACAEHLASCGWRVFGAGRRANASPAQDGMEMLALDVDDEASVRACVAMVVSKAGRLDAVINNAGFSTRGAVEDFTIDAAKAQFETNFFGVLRVCQAALPALRATGGGYIINMSSLAGVVGLPFTGLYCASKFALEGASESLRFEARPFGVHVVIVEPGDFQSEIKAHRRIYTSERSAYWTAFQSYMQRRERGAAAGPTPEPIARLVERILNDKRPKTRYAVGMFRQTILVPLKRLLPQTLFEGILSRALGL